MKIIVSGKNFEVTDALKERVVKKIGKLNKFFNPDTEANVTMSVEKNRHIVEVTIRFSGIVFRAEVSNEDMYTSIDKSVDILEGQIRKNKTRLAKRLHENAFAVSDSIDVHTEEVEEENFKVVRSKRFAIKPMVIEEAIMQMNLLGHEFFVFSNAETKDVNVVYRRKDGNYGLIEPEF
jgi:putative sigma-54 modulation protein